jgi:membrane protease YdiL (CAAX protease family)
VLIELAWFRIAFQLAAKPERFTQTATAIFAIRTLFLPSLALLPALIPYMEKGATGQPPALTSFLAAFIHVWVFVVMVRIVRSAFEWTWPRSIFFFIAAKVVPIILIALVFGDSQKPV